ncbi:hypothetical protein Ciccas_007873 [Cichlidogyrus casuarinus]|uniref:Uncharacterized protein n=1 Tax=Cichlidogyrus casuarinus TaxID=1844966 RepID=A0ABD2Q1V5_9PLAT
MENAQKTIAERKAQLGINPMTHLTMPEGLIADSARAERARRAAELQAKIQAKFNSGIVKNASES